MPTTDSEQVTVLESMFQLFQKYGVTRYKDDVFEAEFSPVAKTDNSPQLPQKQQLITDPDLKMPDDMLGYSCGIDIIDPTSST